MHGSNFSPRLHQRATEQRESPPLPSQTTIIALPSHHIRRGLTCCPPVIVRQQTAEPIVIFFLPVLFLSLFCLADGDSGVRGRCAGCARCLVTLAGLRVHIGCVCITQKSSRINRLWITFQRVKTFIYIYIFFMRVCVVARESGC